MTCASCRFWDRYAESDISKKFGDCRFNPPLISETLLARMLPGLGVPLSDYDDIERDIYIASAFPVTHQESECGRWDGRLPVC
jgi:hypothetical protein